MLKAHRFALRLSRTPSILWIMLTLVIAFSLLTPEFATVSNLFNLARQGAVLAIISVGMTVVIASGGIDLSVGALVGLSGTVIAVTIQRGLSWPIAVLLGIATCSLCGLVSGLVVAKGSVYPFIVTFGMLFMAQSISLGITKGGSVHIDEESFAALGHDLLLGLPTPLWITAAVVTLVAFLVRRTVLGRYVYAIGNNATSAAWLGIDVDRYKTLVYLLSGTMAGVAGTVLASRVVTGNALIGQGCEFDAIAAVVIGGTSLAGGSGSLLGTVMGTIVITVLRNGLSLLGLPSEVMSAVTGGTIMLAVVLAQAILAGGTREG